MPACSCVQQDNTGQVCEWRLLAVKALKNATYRPDLSFTTHTTKQALSIIPFHLLIRTFDHTPHSPLAIRVVQIKPHHIHGHPKLITDPIIVFF